ncbi:cellulase [Penicillium soppii]|uniref:cellulase n=1 Tax=Penicillium soppii TaxID=69789 RepID=UPI002547AC25|nr:cellulase [Penicillium soppii]KAJ5851857.1 cellulase [Penicillium soppii]
MCLSYALVNFSDTFKNRHTDNVRLNTAGVLTAYEDLYNDSGKLKPELQKHYSRPYPAVVPGKAYSYGFEEQSGTFTLRFRSDPNIDTPTKIILPPSTFPNKPFVVIEPRDSLEKYQRDERTLALFTSKSLQSPTDVNITIKR